LREHGPGGLVSGRRAKPSNNRLDAATADRALTIIRERYADFGPTLACEKLAECHGIRLAKETVRRWLPQGDFLRGVRDAGLWIPPSAASRTASSLNSRLYRLCSLRSMRHLAEPVRPSFQVSTERG
jgi:hypothetical protein